MDFSPVINLTWQLACVETTAAKAQFIEPEHLLAALTKLPQFCAARRKLPGGIAVAEARPEMTLVAELLLLFGINATTFRRELRQRFGQGRYAHGKGEIVHRSERSRKMFKHAEKVAGEMVATTVQAGHLFLAMLEERDSVGCRLLVEYRVNLNALAELTRMRILLQGAGGLS
jgi:ATP-dependent Clp protease ATP-binding subunit ClpA